MSHIEGLNAVLGNLENVKLDSIAKFNERMANAGEFLKTVVQVRAGYTDHTQEDLDNYNPRNPYSKKRFPEPDFAPHYDDGIVHKQSGILYNDIRMEMAFNGAETHVAVGVPDSNKHIANLIEGAPAQRPRPFLQRALRESKDDIALILKGGNK